MFFSCQKLVTVILCLSHHCVMGANLFLWSKDRSWSKAGASAASDLDDLEGVIWVLLAEEIQIRSDTELMQ